VYILSILSILLAIYGIFSIDDIAFTIGSKLADIKIGFDSVC